MLPWTSDDSPDNEIEVRGGLRSGDDTNKDLHDAALLGALCNLIVPLVQSVVPNFKNPNTFAEEPEGRDLITALRNYISRIVRAQEESHADGRGSTSQIISTEDAPVEGTDDGTLEDEGPKSIIDTLSLVGALTETLEPKEDEVLHQLLEDLRAYVFNNLPIRLLSFHNSSNSNIEISLVTRAELHANLARQLSDKYMSTPITHPHFKKLVDVKYSILSHTWLRSRPGEITYDDWHKGKFAPTHAGYQKLVNFCRVSMENHSLNLGWMDTLCIDKSSSSELDESIRSMYQWYQNSAVCVTYLAKTTSISDMNKDPWFTRGWTLQELIAPNNVTFYDLNWKRLVDPATEERNDIANKAIQDQIELATPLYACDLLFDIINTPIYTKMKWAANRQVTRSEDTAYSLMGIFNVSISIAYGEGSKRAYGRLIKEIISTAKHNILDIFNWAGDYESEYSDLLPYSPKAYLNCGMMPLPVTLAQPLTLTNMGLLVSVLCLPAIIDGPPVIGFINPKGNFFSNVTVVFENVFMTGFLLGERSFTEGINFNILDERAFKKDVRFNRYAFGVLNFRAVGPTQILIPKHCFSIIMVNYTDNFSSHSESSKVPTTKTITFNLESLVSAHNHFDDDGYPSHYYALERSELKHHGIHILSLYL